MASGNTTDLPPYHNPVAPQVAMPVPSTAEKSVLQPAVEGPQVDQSVPQAHDARDVSEIAQQYRDQCRFDFCVLCQQLILIICTITY